MESCIEMHEERMEALESRSAALMLDFEDGFDLWMRKQDQILDQLWLMLSSDLLLPNDKVMDPVGPRTSGSAGCVQGDQIPDQGSAPSNVSGGQGLPSGQDCDEGCGKSLGAIRTLPARGGQSQGFSAVHIAGSSDINNPYGVAGIMGAQQG